MNKYNNELASCNKMTLKPGFGEFYGGNQVHITRQNDKQLEKNNYKPYLGSGHSLDARMRDKKRSSQEQLKRDEDYREKVNMERMDDTTRTSHQEQLKRDKDNRKKLNRVQTIHPLRTAAPHYEKDNRRLTEDNTRLNSENNRLFADNSRLTEDNTRLNAENNRLFADKLIVVECPELLGVASDVGSKVHIEPRIDKKHGDRVAHTRESICVFFTFLFISYMFYILHLMNKQLYYYTGYQYAC